MPKAGIIAVIVGVIVVAAGGFYFLSQNNGTITDTQTSDTRMTMDGAGGMFMDAFNGAGSVKCIYQDENSQGTAYIKNGMIRAEGQGSSGGQYGSVIFKNDTFWSWETNGTEGVMIENISQYQAADQGLPEGYAVDPNEIANRIEQNKPECNEENIPDSMFEPPSNVNFQNLQGLMDGAMRDSGSGNGIPSQEEINRMMEQYGAQQ